MGSLVEARCTCGFGSRLTLGGGMSDYGTIVRVPVLCESCGTFALLNYLDECPRCEVCGGEVFFYNDPLMRLSTGRGDEGQRVFSWTMTLGFGGTYEIFSLPDADYLCPMCREMKMRFINAGFWD